MARYTTTVDGNQVTLSLSKVDHTISLSRTGGQGTKGDSLQNIQFVNNHLICTVLRSDGTTYEIDAGTFEDNLTLDNLDGVLVTTPQEGDVLLFDAVDNEWKNHQLTTTKLLDVDNTNKADGAVLVYSGDTSKYVATRTIENENTTITGGNF